MFKHFYQIIILLISVSIVPGQLIGIKTIPVAEMAGVGHGYSSNAGMGGVSIAVDDWALDPFTHPAKGRNIQGLFLIGSPTISSISEYLGSTKLLPICTLFGDSLWFGGLSLSIQANEGRQPETWRVLPAQDTYKSLSEYDKDNYQLSASFGRIFIKKQIAIGAGLSWASMNFMPGVDLLYGQNERVKQYGDVYDLRLGVNGWFSGNQTWDITAVYNRIDMTHEIEMQAFGWNGSWNWTQKEEDITETYGVSLEYSRPLSQQAWKTGLLLTLNYKTHPKIPNYTLMNIPRDPGNSIAGNIGVGFSKTSGPGQIGFDIIYEPIRSRTWADASEEILTRSGKTIYPGQKTVYNYFDISNWIVRFGFSELQSPLGMQFGLSARRISYWLDQKDYVTEINRSQYEKWYELRGTWGLRLRLKEFNIHYSGSVTIGTGVPGTEGPFRMFSAEMDMAKSNFVVAPSGALMLDEHEIFIHQIALIIPLFKPGEE